MQNDRTGRCLNCVYSWIRSKAPAQFAKEMQNAVMNVPWAIIDSVMATALCGGLHTVRRLKRHGSEESSSVQAECRL